MKITETSFKNPLNNGSSYIVYITKSEKTADDLHHFAATSETMLNGWHYTVSTVEVCKDCRIPKFFHDGNYHATIVEHNNGDWNKEPTYKLYIVE